MIQSPKGIMKRFQVDILGESFEVKSDAPEEKVLEIVRYVEEKMSEAVSEGRSTSREKAVTLAALNIAEELIKQRDQSLDMKKEVEERSAKLLKLIRREVEGISDKEPDE